MSRSKGEAVGVLVHGGFHGAWCWQRVVEELERRGRRVRTIDLPSRINPTDGLHSDAAATRALVDSIDAPVVLVGHSYGGAVITEASVGAGNVRHLVYVTALVPDIGESVYAASDAARSESKETAASKSQEPEAAEFAAQRARAPGSMDALENRTISCDPDRAMEIFYHDCDPRLAARAVASLVPQPVATLAQETDGAGWRELPSTYVLCTNDRVFDLAVQRYFARRCGDSVVLETSHSPFFSDPVGVSDVIEQRLFSMTASARPAPRT